MKYSESQTPDWARLESGVFEDIVTALLLREHPDGKRIDGAGGDGGIDFVVESRAGALIYQVKHFAGRLGAPQRRQIKKSFERVAGRGLTGWVLVVALDATPGEDTWFSELTEDVRFPGQWRGRRWLDNTICEHDDLRFGLISSAGAGRAEVQDRLAALGNPIVSLDDVMQGQAILAQAASTLSTEFEVFTSTGAQGTVVHLEPKPGSAARFNLDAVRDAVHPADFEALMHGMPIELEAPAEMLGLPSELFAGETAHWKLSGYEGNAFELRLEVLADRRGKTAELSFPSAAPTAGPLGGNVTATDRSGWVTAVFRFGKTSGNLKLSVSASHEAYPSDIVPVLTFFEALSDASTIRIVIRIDGRELPAAEMRKPDDAEHLSIPGLAGYVRDVLAIQNRSGTYHKISIDSDDDVADLNDLIRQLDGETLHSSSSMTLEMTSVPDDLLLEPDTTQQIYTSRGVAGVEIQGVTHRLGGFKQIITCDEVVIADCDQALQARSDGAGCALKLVPVDGRQWDISIVEDNDACSPAPTAS